MNAYLRICILGLMLLNYCYAEFETGPAYAKETSLRSFGDLSYISKEWIDISENYCVPIIRQRDYDKDPFISVAGQVFYIYSKESSDVNYKNNELDIQFIDINEDGYLDIIISGIVNYKEKSKCSQESVVFVYLCDSEKECFELKFKKASFEITCKDAHCSMETHGKKNP